MTSPSADAPRDPEPSSSTPSSSDAADGQDPFEGAPFSSSEGAAQDPYSHEGASHDGPSFGDDPASGDAFGQSQLAIEMAKTWVRQHQTAAMVGAFAIGAFVGALMRD